MVEGIGSYTIMSSLQGFLSLRYKHFLLNGLFSADQDILRSMQSNCSECLFSLIRILCIFFAFLNIFYTFELIVKFFEYGV